MELKRKLQSLCETLKQASQQHTILTLGSRLPAFHRTLEEVDKNLSDITYQFDKYQNANTMKKKIIEPDVRRKLKSLTFNVSFLDRMLDALFVNNILPQQYNIGSGSEEEEKQVGQMVSALSLDAIQDFFHRIEEMDRKLEDIKR